MNLLRKSRGTVWGKVVGTDSYQILFYVRLHVFGVPVWVSSCLCDMFFYPRELDDLDGRDLENQLLLGEIHQHFHVGTLVIAKEQINLDDDEEDDLEEYEDLEDE